MSVIELRRRIDAGHRVVGHEGKCARLHGHTYTIHVELASPLRVEPGFVLDYGDIKEVIDRWDHRMLLWTEDPVYASSDDGVTDLGVHRVPFNPTAENMSDYLCRVFMVKLQDIAYAQKGEEWWKQFCRGFRCKVSVSETPDSIAWCALVGDAL